MPPTSSLISRKNAASSGKSGIDQSHVSHTSNLSIVAVNHKKSASHPDMKALQKELERDPKNVPPLMKVLKRTQKQYLAVKKGFFASLVALLVESHNSALTLVIISIEFLQNLAFCFADVDWGPQGHWMGFVLTLFQVEEAVVKYAGGDAIFVLVAISVALIIIMIVLAFYVVQSFMKSDFNKGVWPLRLLRTLVSFLASVFFLPVMYSLFTIFRCPNQESSTCNSDPLYIVLRILSGFSLPVFFAFTMLMSMTYFNPNPKASSISARPTARLELLELSSKTLLAIFFVFAVESPVLRETVTLICSFSTAVYMWIYIPYYKKEINLYRFTLICQVIWGSIMAIVVTTVGDGQADRIKNLVFYIYLGGILPGILISFFFFNRRQNHATSFAIACQNFKVADTSNFNAWEVDETGTDGEMEKRFWNHNQVEIATRFLITETDPKAIEIADKIFLFGTKKFPNSSALMVQYAIFFLVHKEDPSVAASYLKKAEKLQMLVDTEFTIYQQQQEIKSGGATIGNKKLDAVDRVEFKQLMKEAKQSYKEARASIANFWLAILSAEDKSAVDTAILMQHVSQMERSDHQATESFTRLIARYPLSVKVLSSYADFLDDIHNNHEESELIRRRIKRICDAGLSDDVNHIATPIGANKGVHSSIAGNMMTGSSSAHMTKKSKKAYKEYRKQVYHYSKGNSALLTWMIRGIQVFFIVVAAAQLYVTEYGSQRMRDGISYLQATATCRSAFITVHTDLRNMQSALLNENSTALMIYASEVNATIRLLAQTSSDLYYSTHNKASVNNIWAVPHIPIVFYNGPGTSNNTLFPLTLMDATLMYIRRVNAAIYAILDPGSNTKTIDVANLDWRFALDNGITVILDTYTELEHVIASESRNDVFAMEYAHIGIFAFSLTCLAAISYFLFWPVISKAKTERETSLRAFLQIPKEVTNTLYSKYFDPESASRESLNESNNDDDDKEGKGQSSGIMESLKNTTGYMTMMKISRNGLITIAIFLTASFICDLILLSGTTGIPSSIADAFDVPARGNRIVTVASDVAYWSNTTFSYSPESRNYLGQLLLLDVSEILSSQVALLYGSTTYPHYESNVDSSLLQDIYTSGLDSSSLYGVVSEFIDGATVLANTIPIMPSNPKLLQIGNNLPKIVEGYMYFYDDFLNRSNQSIMLLTNLAYGILAIMVVVIITVHFMYWKRIMNYLIKTENERTLKLLLMIPVEIVADIDSLRELLHLKRTTISGGANSNAAPPPPDIRVMSKSAYTSGRPSFTMHASFGKQFPSEIDENADDEGYVAPNDLMVPPVPSLNVPSSGVASYLARESRRRQSINFTDQPNLLVHKQERISTTEEKRISSYSDGSNRQSKAELDGVAVPRRKSDGTALTGGDMLPKEREKKGSLSFVAFHAVVSAEFPNKAVMLQPLPLELLEHVLSFLELRASFRVVSLVSRAWRAASFSLKSGAFDLGRVETARVVGRFRRLEHARVVAAPEADLFFVRLPASLRSLETPVSRVARKALAECPRLVSVALPFAAQDAARCVAALLALGPSLKRVRVEDPDFAALPQSTLTHRALAEMALGSLSHESLDALPLWLSKTDLPALVAFSLDGDYMNLPENLVANLASTSPSISRFDLRYLSLAPNHVFDIASHLTNLQHLRLQECDAWFYPSENATTISYVLLVKFLTSHLPSLQALELDQCTLNSMDDSNHAMVCRPTIVHGLKSLQIFDLKSQLSTADIHELLFFLENLVSLRLDVIGDVFYDDVIFSRLRISELELRGAVSKGEYNNVVAKISQEPPGSLLKLDVLSLWSAPPLLVQALITSPLNMQNLKRLTINYCFSDSNIDNISLPSLEHLEVKAIGAFAHLTSANAVIALASGSKKLKHLDIGAFRKDSGDLPMSIIQFVAKCVDLRSLKLTNFTVKAKSMQWLCNACRALTLFEITGCQAFSFLNSKDEQMWLVPFLQSHRMMKSFKINVGGIDIGQHRVGEPFVDASLGLMVEGVGFQARSAVVRETRLADMAVYKQYSSDLKKRFWWIETLSIVGPLGGMSFIRE